MSENQLPPINGANRHSVSVMVGMQISRQADFYRMRDYWLRLLAGENDPEEIAMGLCMALSLGRYEERRDSPGSAVTNHISIHIEGAADPEQLAKFAAAVVSQRPSV